MPSATEPLPGTSDLWEPEVLDWNELETASREIFHRYGYCEVRTPIFERTEVFTRSLGDETDVVQKEMYTFDDRGGRSLTLRPEGTAGVIRAIADHGLGTGEEARVFYFGPMFRGERPAAGRRRQFHQVGVEAVGNNSPWMDAECMAMLGQFLEHVGITGSLLKINSRGIPEDRPQVNAALTEHFTPRVQEMCADCQRRLHTNIWRMLDCKQPACQEIASQAPDLVSLMSADTRDFFARVRQALDRLGVAYEVAPRLVRGLDYYIHTVFEVTHDGLGAQDALTGGGRYQITLPGAKKPIEGVGFAAGMERLLMARASLGRQATTPPEADIYLVNLGAEAILPGLQLAQELRADFSGIRVKCDFSSRSLKAQMRSAHRSGARLVLMRGSDELLSGQIICRLMSTSEQQTLSLGDLSSWVSSQTGILFA